MEGLSCPRPTFGSGRGHEGRSTRPRRRRRSRRAFSAGNQSTGEPRKETPWRERREKRGEGKPETFNFLGFTHICGTNHKTGNFTVHRSEERRVGKEGRSR